MEDKTSNPADKFPHEFCFVFHPFFVANRRTRLLITNGGMHSLMEALHWGMPVLGIPLYGPNMRNLEKVNSRNIFFSKISNSTDGDE